VAGNGPAPAGREDAPAAPNPYGLAPDEPRFIQKPPVLQGPVLLDALAELCGRKQSFRLTTPYHSFDSRFIEMYGGNLLVRATMSQTVVKGVLNSYPLYMRFPWDLVTYGGLTRVLGYEAGDRIRNLRIQVPPSVALDNSRAAYRVTRVGRSTGALGSRQLNLVRFTLEDISTGGIGVFCLEPLPAGVFMYGRLVDVSVSLENGPRILAPGRICHVEGQSVGLCFTPPLAGTDLEGLSRWLRPRMEEDQRRWDDRMTLRAISERNAQSKAPPQGVLLVSCDDPARGVLEKALSVFQLRTVPPALAAIKDAVGLAPPHLLAVAGNGQPEETHRLRLMLEAVAPACPVVVIGTGPEVERARRLAADVRAAVFVDLKMLHPVIFQRLVQGLIRRHWDVDPLLEPAGPASP
jgi:hypothetical protein